MSWFRRFWGGRQAADTPPSRPAPSPVAAATAPPGNEPALDDPVLLPWLLGFDTLQASDVSADEQRLLDLIRGTLAQPAFPERLLPRAANLIPQLIALLRQTDLPTAEVATRVARDPVLSTEVMRLADSPYYRGQDPVRDLEQAVTRIGQWGLQQVIARVVLKPIYQGHPGPWSARAGSRRWVYSEALAREAADLAGASGQSPFDAYLAGMLHGTGWIVALNLADQAGLPGPSTLSQAFATLVEDPVHRLFGHAAQRWDITPGFTAFARAAYHHGPQEQSHALSPVLQDAHRRSLLSLQPG